MLLILLVISPMFALAELEPGSLADAQKSFNLLEGRAFQEGNSQIGFSHSRISDNIAKLTGNKSEFQPNYNDYSSSSSDSNYLDYKYAFPSLESNRISESDLDFLIGDANVRKDDSKSNAYRDLGIIVKYENDEKDNSNQNLNPYAHSRLDYNLVTIANQINNSASDGQIWIGDEIEWRDMDNQLNYIYETQIGPDDQNRFEQSDMNYFLNKQNREDSNDKEENIIRITNQYDWDNIRNPLYGYEYKKNANPDYEIINANFDSIASSGTNREKATDFEYNYSYKKSSDNFNKIMDFENKISKINNKSDNIALVIGIDDYDSMSKLHNSINDAEAISRVIKDYGYEVIKITDNSDIKPTKENLELALSFMQYKYKNKNNLIYFSGHGVLDDKGSFYFVPKGGNESVSSYISAAEVEERTDNLKNLAIVIDACNSGAYETKKPGRLVIASSEANQKSNEQWFGNLSIFTNGLYRALDEQKTKSNVALQECFLMAQNYTKRWILWPLLRQDPQMIGQAEETYYLK